MKLEDLTLAEKDFNKLLLEAIDDALASLGESAKKAVYFHLENKFKIRKKDIPYDIENFTDGIEKIFGLGAKFIEILIMKKLYEKVGCTLEWNEKKELNFVEYVATAKKSFLKKRTSK